jgi:hypothetical protein
MGRRARPKVYAGSSPPQMDEAGGGGAEYSEFDDIPSQHEASPPVKKKKKKDGLPKIKKVKIKKPTLPPAAAAPASYAQPPRVAAPEAEENTSVSAYDALVAGTTRNSSLAHTNAPVPS